MSEKHNSGAKKEWEWMWLIYDFNVHKIYFERPYSNNWQKSSLLIVLTIIIHLCHQFSINLGLIIVCKIFSKQYGFQKNYKRNNRFRKRSSPIT